MTPTTPPAATRTVFVAIGGNALVLDGEPGSIPQQQQRAAHFAEQIADLMDQGWTVLVSHGNGPQVGFILRRGELVAPEASIEGLPELPLWLAVADSQGGIGHLLAVAINSALSRRGRSATSVAVLTHAEVDPQDPAFDNPTKPIGSQMTREVALVRAQQEGWSVVETSPGAYRRVVPSPRPRRIVETDQIRALVATGAVVIAAGGGGIPVVPDGNGWTGIDAVVDKDRASAVLAASIGVDALVLVTGVDQVYVRFGTPEQKALDELDTETARGYLAGGEFPAGSMGPKIESALQFVEESGGRAVITSLPRLSDALAGRAGTHITSRTHGAAHHSPGAAR